jgi:hypothetical protein
MVASQALVATATWMIWTDPYAETSAAVTCRLVSNDSCTPGR